MVDIVSHIFYIIKKLSIYPNNIMETQLTKYYNFFDEDTFTSLQSYAYDVFNGKKPYFGRTNLHWNKSVVKESTPVLVADIVGGSTMFNELNEKIYEKTGKLAEKGMMLYCWTKYSYIPWHNDAHCSSALTIYLNDYWDEDWGGYFMYKNDKEIKAIVPERNLGVLQENGIFHATTTINPDADKRYSFQIFFDEK